MVKVKVKKSGGAPYYMLQIGGLLLLVILVTFGLSNFKEDLSTINSNNVMNNNNVVSPTLRKEPPPIHQLSAFKGETILLRSSIMPVNGFGTCCRRSSKGNAIYASTLDYLKLGGRLIDTAMAYGNHKEIGQAVRDSSVPRDNVWITSKISPNRLKGKVYKNTIKAVDNILEELNVGSYLDLCLIHTPKLGMEATVNMWKALITAQNDGKIKSIGVSNFNKAEILHLMSTTGVIPEVNQIQYHPWTSPEWKELVQWHKENNIVTTAYNSLGGSRFHSNGKIEWPNKITQLAQQNEVTESQVLLRWALLQDKVAVIPGATSAEHIRENLNVPQFTFDLDALAEADMPPNWFDAKRGPVKYRAMDAMGKAWTGDHSLPKKV